jgi:hypothetical protein
MDSDRIIKDDIYQFENLEISPIDRPSYVTCLIDDEKMTICGYFINDAEEFCDVWVDEKLEFYYGNLSGRIKKLITSNTKLFETTLYRSMQLLPEGLNTRISNNIKEYMKLYGSILDILESSLKYKKEEDVLNMELIG